MEFVLTHDDWRIRTSPENESSVEIPGEAMNLTDCSVGTLAVWSATRPVRARLQLNPAGFKQILSQSPDPYVDA